MKNKIVSYVDEIGDSEIKHIDSLLPFENIELKLFTLNLYPLDASSCHIILGLSIKDNVTALNCDSKDLNLMEDWKSENPTKYSNPHLIGLQKVIKNNIEKLKYYAEDREEI